MNGKTTQNTNSYYDQKNGTKHLNKQVQHSTAFTTNIEVHGGHQARTGATVQLPELDLAAGAGLWRRGLERQEGWGRWRGRGLQ